MPPVKGQSIPIHVHAPSIDSDSDLLLSSLCLTGASATVHQCIGHVLNILRIRNVAGVRSVSLFLDHMDGVAYTKGSDFDDAHKEIHMSVKYFANIVPRDVAPTSALAGLKIASATPLPQSAVSGDSHNGTTQERSGQQGQGGQPGQDRLRHEVLGVVTHELVHCFQYNARGTMPGGLIEGIADFVRLKAGLAPPHWSRGAGKTWDEGYAVTAYFLDWCDKQYGDGKGGFVSLLNDAHRDIEWKVEWFETYTGHSVHELWDTYRTTWT